MATIAIGPMRPYKTFHGGPPFRMSIPEKASQTFKSGAIIVADTAGKAQEASADPTRILGVSEGDGKDIASPLDSDKTILDVADTGTIFVANVSTAQVTAQTDIGASYGVTKVGDNWTIDKTKVSTSRRIRVVDLDPRDVVGDTCGRLLFQFIQNFTGLSYTS
jgi:hypothetical protein